MIIDVSKSYIVKIGITGQSGFIGSHLYYTLGCFCDRYHRVDFDARYFETEKALDQFVAKCDVIIHLAGVNRSNDPDFIYRTNIDLVQKLIASLRRTGSKAHVLFSSSSQEGRNNAYGQSKRDSRALFSKWADISGGVFTGLIIPNVFGPFGLPYYNSFISTFCYQLTHSKEPKVEVDESVKLIYVGELIKMILGIINERESQQYRVIANTAEIKVSQVLEKIRCYKNQYVEKGEIPRFNTHFDLNLFNTLRSYIDHGKYFPVKLMQQKDDRGSFVEIIRLCNGGQVSFSTTFPGVTRGNHYHTRKVERFAVIRGKALIQLRKVGSDKILSFELHGDEPAYVDIPIWYIHNITNVGNNVLYTNFWISEVYDPNDADTFFEAV